MDPQTLKVLKVFALSPGEYLTSTQVGVVIGHPYPIAGVRVSGDISRLCDLRYLERAHGRSCWYKVTDAGIRKAEQEWQTGSKNT
jgi:hypothetical protein